MKYIKKAAEIILIPWGGTKITELFCTSRKLKLRRSSAKISLRKDTRRVSISPAVILTLSQSLFTNLS